jgi:hypothetical protein
MAVIGEQAVYLSHLSMFMKPHDYQVILMVDFIGNGNPQEVYFGDRRNNPRQRLYTFNPDRFVLPTLFPVDGRLPEATSFRGTLHRGHFERNDSEPVQIAADVTAQVTKVIHQHRYGSGTDQLEELQYFMFGKGSEILMAHHITLPPDSDQLMSVDIDGQFSDEDLSNGMVVKVTGRPNTIATRIKPGVDTELPAIVEIDGHSQPIKIRPKVEYYFETGELAEAM